MKKVAKNYIVRPSSLRVTRAPYRTAIAGVLGAGGWTAAASNLYSSPSVKQALNQIYNGKCAFCENKPVGNPPQVEHYRPKNGINGLIHTGYYWLAYEWSNLLLACGNCNSTKGTWFPIEHGHNRILAPTTIVAGQLDESTTYIRCLQLRNERPILLNPEVDNPFQHIAFTPTGEIVHLTDRGEISIERYDLNRDELYVNGRLRIKNSIENKFLRRLARYDSGERNARTVIDDLTDVIIEEIITPISNNESFSEFFKQMLLYNKDYFIIGDRRSSLLLHKAFLNVINSL